MSLCLQVGAGRAQKCFEVAATQKLGVATKRVRAPWEPHWEYEANCCMLLNSLIHMQRCVVFHKIIFLRSSHVLSLFSLYLLKTHFCTSFWDDLSLLFLSSSPYRVITSSPQKLKYEHNVVVFFPNQMLLFKTIQRRMCVCQSMLRRRD